MHHFGRPLVDSPSDFGLRSPPPTHPELLDHLATELVEGGWSLKAIHRRMLLSSAYRQASGDRAECAAVDPENRLLWKANRRRLEFEALRDSILCVAGRLEPRIGGPPFELMAKPAIARRTVYALVDRQDLPNVLRVFDFASPDQSAPQRPQTTVPQQALFLLNGALAAEQAAHVASRPEVATAANTEARIVALYRVVFAREPSPEEVKLAADFLASADAATGWKQFAAALIATNEFAFVD
jgi:hypothetical protein